MTAGSLPRGATTVLVALVLIVATVRVAIMDRPFIANSEGLACGWVLSSVRNYVRYGPAVSRYAGVLNSGETAPANWIIYSHHPPLTLLLGAVPMWLAGDAEWAGRFVPAVFSIATTVLLIAMARRRFGLRVAAVTGLIYALCPMTLAFGDMAEYLNAPLVFCGVATIGAYVRWRETQRRGWAYAAMLFFLLGALSDWPIFYLVPLLAAHAVLTGAMRVMRVSVMVLASALLFAALAGWMLWSGGDVSVAQQFALRASRDGITLRDWFARVVIEHQGMLHSWPVLVLSGIWVLHFTRRCLMGRWPEVAGHTIPLLLIAWGAVHLVVGVQGTYLHAWWSMLLTPAFALMAALGVEVVIGALPRWMRRRPVAVPLAALAVLLFVASSAHTAREVTGDEWGFDGDDRLKHIGTAISAASGPSEGVLTSVNTYHPALWFYADRQLRPAITSVAALQGSLDAGPYVVFYKAQQRSGPPPTWFVMPTSDQALLPELTATLDASYPRREMDGVVIYRLRP